ncbi:IS4 family transposase [Flavobacterium aurantiibacter]|uniref:Transposase n=1 Tax=Flavobacterium aurantiibacter TaxID=2023067 RepID=A0A256A3L7_9FLAO|nr:IS4 family transposase [Flavobacterium aurantiibacter]OYQ48229.1 transposase [Flavobacterium aurantiibacter]
MNKSSYFFGQSVFGQLISLIDSSLIRGAVKKHNSDHYVKKFDTSDHLISMLFSTFAHCTSLREVSASMLGLKGKTNHFQLKNIPYKSTLSDANKRRSHLVFQDIYYDLLKQYQSIISDSRKIYSWEDKLEIIDSSTISLFKDILSCVGRTPSNGKKKGGIKIHTQINLQENVPKLIWFSAATTHDKQFLKHIQIKKGKIAVFDKGYNDYKTFDEFTENGIHFVTRLKSNASYESIRENDIPSHIDNGVIKDEVIQVAVKKNGSYVKTIELRKIAYWDDEHGRCFEFITNLHGMNAGHIALIYKKRWQIELLFKQLKQNFPLKYFLGDNENSIKIQIWCTLIVNLLLTIIRKKIKRKWAFSNLACFCRLHLFNYIHLVKYLENPEKDWIKEIDPQLQLNFSP